MSVALEIGLVCPACGGDLDEGEAGRVCRSCALEFPDTAGLPDLRLRSDRYLGIAAERAKAERLAEIAATSDLAEVARAYYEMTHDVDPRRCRLFLRHILSCDRRGEMLARRIGGIGPTLELGCGTGGLLCSLGRSGSHAVGVDVASRWLVVARRRLDDAGLSLPLVAADAEALPWPDGSFGAVVADSLVEHLDDPAPALREAFRVLRPGGALLLWSPNRRSLLPDPHVRLWGVGFLPRRLAEAYVDLRRGGAWLPRTTTPRAIAKLVAQAGFEAVRSGPIRIEVDDVDATDRDRRLLKMYRWFHALPCGHGFLSVFGPLWELRARKPE